jgi:threonine dehydrogenase-like Zn-dependent dehydrogenase
VTNDPEDIGAFCAVNGVLCGARAVSKAWFYECRMETNCRKANRRHHIFKGGGNIMNAVVVVVIGAGGIGIAIARRQGFGKHILLADFNEELLETAARELEIPLTLKSSPSNRSTRPTRGS